MRITLTLLSFLIMFSQANAQEYIWGGPGDKNTEFDGGLNNWTTFGFSNGVENSKAIFYWDEDGNANAGAYALDTEPINSSSVNNGAVAFDSDYLDSGGVEMGQGEVTAPHLSYLVSPVINLENESEVTLKFNQSFRKYQSTTKVEVTNDNGNTWTAFEVNESLGENERLKYDYVSLIDISSVAANQEAVQFRFVFEGSYYYWVIDDVSLIKTPENELSLGDYYYPVNSRTLPRPALNADTLKFWCDVKNSIGEKAFGTATVQITNDEETEVYLEFIQAFENIENGTTKRIYFEDYVLPEDVFDVFKGENFKLKYFLKNESEVGDLYLGDNLGVNRIIVTYEYGVSSLNEGVVGIGGASPFTIINVYETGSRPIDCGWRAFQLTTGLSADNVSTLTCNYEANIWKVDESVDEDLSQIIGENSLENEPLLTPVGYGFGSLEDHDLSKDFSLESGLLDSKTDEEGVLLEPNTKYFVSIKYKDVDFDLIGALRPHCGTSIKYFQPVVFISDDEGIYKLPNKSWAWKIIMHSDLDNCFAMSTDNKKELDNVRINVFPAPARGILNVDFSLEKSEEIIQFDIYNLRGQSVMQKTLQNVQSKTLSWDLEGLPSGQYLIRINTNEGYKSAKFTITK